MEHTRIRLGNDSDFDQAVHGGLKDEAGVASPVLRDAGDLLVITKDRGTVEGRPCVCLTFTVELPGGQFARAQTVVTGRIFAAIAAAFRGRYGAEGDLPPIEQRN